MTATPLASDAPTRVWPPEGLEALHGAVHRLTLRSAAGSLLLLVGTVPMFLSPDGYRRPIAIVLLACAIAGLLTLLDSARAAVHDAAQASRAARGLATAPASSTRRAWIAAAGLALIGLAGWLLFGTRDFLTESTIAIVFLAGPVGVFLVRASLIAGPRAAEPRPPRAVAPHGWLTIAEVAADGYGDGDDLIAGTGRFARFHELERNAMRRRGLWRSAARLAAALSPLPVLVLVLRLGSTGHAGPGAFWATVIVPLLFVLFGTRSLWTGDAPIPDAPPHVAWSVPLVAIGALVATFVLTTIVGTVVFVTSVGAVLWAHELPHYENTRQKTFVAEAARGYTLPVDSTITPLDAGHAFLALQGERKAGRALFNDVPPVTAPWRTQPAPADLFPGGTGAWNGPGPLGLISAAAHGFTPAQLAYLEMVAHAPVWKTYETVARAPAMDLVGGQFKLPFAVDLSFFELPIPRFAATKELAYAGVARAAYHYARGQRDSAEHALRAVTSFGYALEDNANTIIEMLIGRVIVEIGREGLDQFYAAAGRPEAARLRARRDSLTEAAKSLPTVLGKFGVGGSVEAHDYATTRAEALHLASLPSASRPVRIAYLAYLATAACGNARELVFGPAPPVREAFAEARRAMERWPSDEALLGLVAGTLQQPIVVQEYPRNAFVNALLFVSTATGRALHNRPVENCLRAPLLFGSF